MAAALLAGCAGSGGRSSRSASADAPDLPPPLRTVLRNGMRLTVQEPRAADIVAVYLFVGVGTRHETADQLGYAHFQEHMLFKGTDKFGPGYVDRVVEGVGGRSNAVTSFDYTTFSLSLPTEATATGIQLLSDMAFRSTPARPARAARPARGGGPASGGPLGPARPPGPALAGPALRRRGGRRGGPARHQPGRHRELPAGPTAAGRRAAGLERDHELRGPGRRRHRQPARGPRGR